MLNGSRDVARVEHVEVGRPVLHGRGMWHGTPLVLLQVTRMPHPSAASRAVRGRSGILTAALSGRAVQPHTGRAGCWHGRAPGCTQSRSRHDMTGTTAQKPSGDGGVELPRPRRELPLALVPTARAFAAGGVLAAVLGLGVATGARRRRGHHARRATRGTAAHGRLRVGMARPTVAGRITCAQQATTSRWRRTPTTSVTVVISARARPTRPTRARAGGPRPARPRSRSVPTSGCRAPRTATAPSRRRPS